MSTYVDVILPLALANTYTYILPEEYWGRANVGMRVIVPFGGRKLYTALIYALHTEAPDNFEPKEIMALLDDSRFLVTTKWISGGGFPPIIVVSWA